MTQASSPQTSTPRARGYRTVAEWEPNAACITAWPAHEYAWGGFLAAAQREFAAFCTALAGEPGNEPIVLLVPSAEAEVQARAALAGIAGRVHFERMAYGDIWLRDTTPIFLRGPEGLASVRFRCNGWGGKYRYPGDDELAEKLAAQFGVPGFAFDRVLEGGAVEFDGEGTCLTTESCLLNPNRGASPAQRGEIEAMLREAFAASKVIWLREGLAGDHTDGHIDNIARFVRPGVVMHMRPGAKGDPNRDALAAIEAALADATDAAGRPLTLVPVPSPGAVLDAQGEPIAASYMNFYLANRSVIVPSFGTDSDAQAAQAIAAAFPERNVVLRSARAILEGGGGTFHCMTRQRPEEARR